MNVLDTNVISELMRGNPHPAVLTWLDNQLASSLFVTAITETEILTGIAIRNVVDFEGTGVEVINPWETS